MRNACSTQSLYSAGVRSPIMSVRPRMSVLRFRQLSDTAGALVPLPSNTRLLLPRDHAAREPTLALAKATGLGCGRVRTLAWCSRRRSEAALLEGALDDAVPVHVARLPFRRESREEPYHVLRAALAAGRRIRRSPHQLLEPLLACLAAVRVDRHGRSLTYCVRVAPWPSRHRRPSSGGSPRSKG